MPSPFPHRYEVQLLGADEDTATLTVPGRPVIVGAAPPEFDGPPGRWSPEHLLLSSVALCLMTTYRALAGRSRLAVAGYESRAQGTLEKTGAGLAFTSIVVHVDVVVDPSQVERAESLMESAKKHCIVSNALRVPVLVTSRVRASDGVTA